MGLFSNLTSDAQVTKWDNKFKFVIAIFVIFLLCRHFSFDMTYLRNVDMEPFSEPIQIPVSDIKTFEKKVVHGKVYITPVAKYQIYGRVMQHHYRPRKLYGADVYPYDVSIGFGPYQYKEVYKAIKVRMASTVSYWQYSPKYRKELFKKYFKDKGVNHYSTNNHLCPANKRVKRGISRLRKKDVVYLEGYLIKYTYMKNDGSIQKGYSSTSRDDPPFMGDHGSGSCEQIYVTRIVTRHGDYH